MTGAVDGADIRRLIISPHPDDAVLSATAAILTARTSVLTVFCGVPSRDTPMSEWDRICGASDADSHARKRIDEDIAALAVLGADYIHLDLLDEQYRTAPVPQLLLRDQLERICDDFNEVWFPAGVGSHTDHRIVAEIAAGLRGDFRRFCYADMPYAMTAWGGRLTENDLDIGAIVRSTTVGVTSLPVPRLLTDSERELKRAAVSAYKTQIVALESEFTDPRFTFDSITSPVEYSWELDRTTRSPGPAVVSRDSVQATAEAVFTVIVRTRATAEPGPVLEALAEQTFSNFEVVVLVEIVNNAPSVDMTRHIPPTLRSRTRVVSHAGANWCAAVNSAMSEARSAYLNLLDDRDWVSADWLAEFSRMTEHHPGRVLRAASAQAFGDAAPYKYPIEFDFVAHLTANRTPMNSVAIPIGAVHKFGLLFREDLDGSETWEFLVRSVEACGLAGSDRMTAERWQSGDQRSSPDNNQTLAGVVAARKFHSACDARSLTLPVGSSKQLRDEREELEALRARVAQLADHNAKLANNCSSMEVLCESLEKQHVDAAPGRAGGETELESLAGRLREFENRIAELTPAYDAYQTLEPYTRDLQDQLRLIERSSSWRMTSPLRRSMRVARRLRQILDSARRKGMAR